MIEIDGAEGEGGGQVLRSSLSLSMLTGQTIALHSIRGKRPKPGLMRQHLACVQAAQRISSAQVQGAELGSRELRFTPGPVAAGHYRFEIATAGSCLLVLQTVWPALMRAQGASELILTGGTHNPLAPPYPFIEQAFAPLLARLGAPASLTLRRAGFFPAGGGEVRVRIEPAAELTPFDLMAPGDQILAHAQCVAPALPRSVADRCLTALGSQLAWPKAALQPISSRQNEGPGLALWATLQHAQVTEVFCALGEKGLSAEALAQQVTDELRAYQKTGAALGPHLADQWLLPLAMAVQQSGRAASFTASEWTLHASTNAALIERFLPVRIGSVLQPSGLHLCRVAPA